MNAGRILVTGANGFVGRALCRELAAAGYGVRGAVRTPLKNADKVDMEWRVVGDVGPGADWSQALWGVEAVVHLAARVHVMREIAADPLAEFRRVNVEGTRSLARAAAEAGVRRLVFVSTLKVHGDSSGARSFSESDPPRPADPYAVSKWEAEQALHEIAGRTGLETVILRPPLIYGPGVKGNFLRLLQTIDRGIPLPLSSVRNARSLIFIGNLVDAIMACMTRPQAAAQTYLVCDAEALSTRELIFRIAHALGRRVLLWPLPPGAIRLLASLAGREEDAARLLDSLVVDSSKIRRELNWTPPYSLDQGLQETARWRRDKL